MAYRPLPWLDWHGSQVSEVMELMAEQCAQAITQWHGGGCVQARQGCGGDGAVLGLLWRVTERQREGERARVSERGGFASFFSPCWLDQPGEHQRAAATWRAWPRHGRPRRPADLNQWSIQSTETTIFALLYLLICGKILKTSVIQSVELHDYYNFAIMIKA